MKFDARSLLETARYRGLHHLAVPTALFEDLLEEREKDRQEIERLREAVGPLAVLKVPDRPQGNAGAYSIRHEDIKRAQAALSEPQGEDDGWPEAISNGLALPCSLCGQKPSFDYGVHDEIWGRIAPAEHRLSVICLPCLDSLGAEAGISVGSHLIEVQFTGHGHTTVLRPVKSYFYAPQTGDNS